LYALITFGKGIVVNKEAIIFLLFTAFMIISPTVCLPLDAKNRVDVTGIPKPLVKGAEKDDVSKLRSLAAKGMNLAAKDEDGSTLLHIASRAGAKNTVAFLLSQGFDPNGRSQFGTTPLHDAKTSHVARLLVARGADVNAKDTEFMMTPAFNAPLAVLDFLITKGADLEATNKEGMTVLAWAAYSKNIPRIRLLLSKGAKVNGGENSAKTALHVAANWGHIEVAQLLLAHGAHVNAKDGTGWTPLHWAASEGGVAIAQFLLSHGAGVNEISNAPMGKFSKATALDIAEDVGFSEMVLFFKSVGGKRAKDLP
jgi:ankyrin repeat protein